MTAPGYFRPFRDVRVTSAHSPRAATKRTLQEFASVVRAGQAARGRTPKRSYNTRTVSAFQVCLAFPFLRRRPLEPMGVPQLERPAAAHWPLAPVNRAERARLRMPAAGRAEPDRRQAHLEAASAR